jgi:hypothetical protein
MQAVTITQITPPELETIIEGSVKKALFIQRPEIDRWLSPENIVDTAEICRRLGITEPTAIRYRKKGKIPFFTIGSAIRYNWQKVLESLEGKKEGRHE